MKALQTLAGAVAAIAISAPAALAGTIISDNMAPGGYSPPRGFITDTLAAGPQSGTARVGAATRQRPMSRAQAVAQGYIIPSGKTKPSSGDRSIAAGHYDPTTSRWIPAGTASRALSHVASTDTSDAVGRYVQNHARDSRDRAPAASYWQYHATHHVPAVTVAGPYAFGGDSPRFAKPVQDPLATYFRRHFTHKPSGGVTSPYEYGGNSPRFAPSAQDTGVGVTSPYEYGGDSAALSKPAPGHLVKNGYDPRAYVPGSAPGAVARAIQDEGLGRRPSAGVVSSDSGNWLTRSDRGLWAGVAAGATLFLLGGAFVARRQRRIAI
jgi:hypothetical protein